MPLTDEMGAGCLASLVSRHPVWTDILCAMTDDAAVMWDRRQHLQEARLQVLDDRALWGRAITDERYPLLSRR